jgi:hypothetical protein
VKTRSTMELVAVASAASLALSCASPVNDDAIEALGGELAGIKPETEWHRPGQPCLLCHGDYLADSPILLVAGTVFAAPTSATFVNGAVVEVTNAQGNAITRTTNCTGNFFVEEDNPEGWIAAFPLFAAVTCPDPNGGEPRRVVMGTRIGRDGSCAGCHLQTPSATSPGWVYCATTDPGYPKPTPATCEGLEQ